MIKPNVNRGELCDANPPHRRWARVCKKVRLWCHCHLDSHFVFLYLSLSLYVSLYFSLYLSEHGFKEEQCHHCSLPTPERVQSQWWKASKSLLLQRHRWSQKAPLSPLCKDQVSHKKNIYVYLAFCSRGVLDLFSALS